MDKEAVLKSAEEMLKEVDQHLKTGGTNGDQRLILKKVKLLISEVQEFQKNSKDESVIIRGALAELIEARDKLKAEVQ